MSNFPPKTSENVLIVCCRCELSGKEEIRKKMQELQEQKLAKEKEGIHKLSKIEEEMMLLV